MQIKNYGFFTRVEGKPTEMVNSEGAIWYDLRNHIIDWDYENAQLIDGKHTFWVDVDADGIVWNVETDPSFLMPFDRTVLGVDGVHPSAIKPGMIYKDGAFSAPPVEAPTLRPLTPREFRDALIDNDIMPDQVTAAINQIADVKARAKALNAWEYPTEFSRTDPLIEQIAAIFGLTPEAIDTLWKEAAGIT